MSAVRFLPYGELAVRPPPRCVAIDGRRTIRTRYYRTAIIRYLPITETISVITVRPLSLTRTGTKSDRRRGLPAVHRRVVRGAPDDYLEPEDGRRKPLVARPTARNLLERLPPPSVVGRINGTTTPMPPRLARFQSHYARETSAEGTSRRGCARAVHHEF